MNENNGAVLRRRTNGDRRVQDLASIRIGLLWRRGIKELEGAEALLFLLVGACETRPLFLQS